MAQKTKASVGSLVEEESPSKVLRQTPSDPEARVQQRAQAADAAEIPEARLQAEIQLLLVGADLSAVTLGALRAKLEERLGLGAGVLAARKTIRRRVDFVVQHEVRKRAQRSSHCELIVKELLELPEYPTEARQMLIDSLAQATASASGVLHAHQVQLLRMTCEALGDGRGRTSESLTSSEAQVKEAREELQGQEARLAEVTAAEAAAQLTAEAAAESLQETQQEVVQLAQELEEAKDAARLTLEETANIRKEREVVAAMQAGHLRTLLDGSWTSEEAFWESFGAVQQYLLDTKAENSLLTAVTVALRRRPEERSFFDKMAAESIESLLVEELAAVDARIAARAQAEFKAEAGVLGAASILSATTSHAAKLSQASDGAREAHQAATVALKATEARSPELQAIVADRQAEQTQLSAKQQRLEEVIGMLDRWVADGRCAPVREESAAEVPEVPGVPETPEAPEVPEAPEASSEVSEASEAEVALPLAETECTAERVAQSPMPQTLAAESKLETLAQSPCPKTLATESKLETASDLASPRRLPTPLRRSPLSSP
mmetsp:Transcript_44278/g.71693  ORF Transcript_44278/g.71693 Transcript_44278/m.71693 type:complete len:551 (-) Transcript_44278:93-1745(-)